MNESVVLQIIPLQMSAINLVKAVPEREQERIRSLHSVRASMPRPLFNTFL
jgi:hypothetical protein